MRRFCALLLGVWLGLHLGFGYIVAPLVFTRLSSLADGKILAGNIAGSLFHIVHLFGIAVWFAAYFLARCDNRYGYRKTHMPHWIGVLIGVLAINEFLITPVIEAIKNHKNNWLYDLIGGSFNAWHGASSIVYLVCMLLGTALCAQWMTLHKNNY